MTDQTRTAGDGEALVPCPHCDFSSGHRGMDTCSKCKGTGVLYTPSQPNAHAAARWALEEDDFAKSRGFTPSQPVGEDVTDPITYAILEDEATKDLTATIDRLTLERDAALSRAREAEERLAEECRLRAQDAETIAMAVNACRLTMDQWCGSGVTKGQAWNAVHLVVRGNLNCSYFDPALQAETNRANAAEARVRELEQAAGNPQR